MHVHRLCNEHGYWLWYPELSLLVVSREIMFYESPILLGRRIYESVHTDLDDVWLEMKLQPEY